ncbi:hypothetical protein ACQCVE_17130 [Metabacillus sp. 113a]|uniref:hypothetical protein n=1 Tax=Metabacillus sp. 113a TaxID=3404706 RepID=UPI003CF2C836
MNFGKLGWVSATVLGMAVLAGCGESEGGKSSESAGAEETAPKEEKNQESENKDAAKAGNEEGAATLDKFLQLKAGMSYEEIADIMGSKGEKGTATEIEIYTWRDSEGFGFVQGGVH